MTTFSQVSSRVLKNVFEGLSARRKLSKKRSLHLVNEHFETIFNTAIATQIVFQQPANKAFVWKMLNQQR